MNFIQSISLAILVASGLGTLSSCSSTPEYTEPEVHIEHSSPDVISLYNKPAKPKPTVASSIAGSLLDGLIDGMLSSSPDDDDDFGEDRYHSRKEKRTFIKNNKRSIQDSLRNKR